MIIMIDNYDSFTYNLVHYLRQLQASVKVIRNDTVSVDELISFNPSGIVISPGPGRPESAGISVEVVKRFTGKIPILGVCLGHQSIAVALGGSIVQAGHIMHGKTSMIAADGKTLYCGIDSPFAAMRYHSLAVSRQDLPKCFEVSSWADDGEIMGIRHKEHATEGIQFHPESIMTPDGMQILKNFLQLSVSGKA